LFVSLSGGNPVDWIVSTIFICLITLSLGIFVGQDVSMLQKNLVIAREALSDSSSELYEVEFKAEEILGREDLSGHTRTLVELVLGNQISLKQERVDKSQAEVDRIIQKLGSFRSYWWWLPGAFAVKT